MAYNLESGGLKQNEFDALGFYSIFLAIVMLIHIMGQRHMDLSNRSYMLNISNDSS